MIELPRLDKRSLVYIWRIWITAKKEKWRLIEIEIAAYNVNRAAANAILSLNPSISKLSKAKLKILFCH